MFSGLAIDGGGRTGAWTGNPDGWTAAAGAYAPVEESPGSTEIRCRLTAGGGDPRDSATENKPPKEPGGAEGKGETGR